LNNLNIWLNAFRLRTLPLSLSGIIIGWCIALIYNVHDWSIFIFSILTTVCFQVLSNLSNDLGDTIKGADNKERVGPSRAVQAGLISKKSMKVAILITGVFSILFAVILILLSAKGMSNSLIVAFLVFAVLSVLCAITYTIGKNAYGYYGFGDLMVFVFFGLVSVFGSFGLYFKSLSLICLLPSISFGLLSVAVLNLNNLRDCINDKASGKKTVVVRLGFNRAKRYHYAILIFSFISYFFFVFLIKEGFFVPLKADAIGDPCAKLYSNIIYIGMLAYIPLIPHFFRVYKCSEPYKLDSELKIVALSTFACSILTCIGIIFS